MSRTYALAAAGAVVVTLGGIFAYTEIWPRISGDPYVQCRGGAVAGDIGGPFELVSETGETVTDADVITAPTLLYFGYTFCPDVCPLDTMRNAQAIDILDERGIAANTAFITIDPARDTPEVVDLYTDNSHDRMIGLTGSPEQVDAVSKAYRTYYRKVEDGAEDDYYLMDHSTFSYIVLPEVGFVDFVRREDTPEDVAERMACFADIG